MDATKKKTVRSFRKCKMHYAPLSWVGKNEAFSIVTSQHETHALNNSPVTSIGGIKRGKPTTVEQNSISVCT